jgi:hypothetical protein
VLLFTHFRDAVVEILEEHKKAAKAAKKKVGNLPAEQASRCIAQLNKPKRCDHAGAGENLST